MKVGNILGCFAPDIIMYILLNTLIKRTKGLFGASNSFKVKYRLPAEF